TTRVLRVTTRGLTTVRVPTGLWLTTLGRIAALRGKSALRRLPLGTRLLSGTRLPRGARLTAVRHLRIVTHRCSPSLPAGVCWIAGAWSGRGSWWSLCRVLTATPHAVQKAARGSS